MTGILIPELVIYQTIENITRYIRNDLKTHENELEKTFLYRLLGLDDDENPIKMNRYNYFRQAKKIFDNVQNLTVNFGYNFEVAKIISFHIILPSEQASSIPIGEDEGYQNEEEEDGIQMKFCQMFSSNYQIMITSDNSTEVNTVYHIYKSLLIALVPHLSLKGLMNPKFSGNDIVFQDDQMPMGIFHKVLNISFDYELVVPQILLRPFINDIYFDGTAGNFEFNSGDVVGNTEYPNHDVELGKPINYDLGDPIPYHVIDSQDYEDNTAYDVNLVITNKGELAAGVRVELSNDRYLYISNSNDKGVAVFPKVAKDVYRVIIRIDDVIIETFDDVKIDSSLIHINIA